MRFELTEDQEVRFEKWRKKMKKKYPDTAFIVGGAYTFSFCPTGIGTSVVITHGMGESLDLSDYKTW